MKVFFPRKVLATTTLQGYGLTADPLVPGEHKVGNDLAEKAISFNVFAHDTATKKLVNFPPLAINVTLARKERSFLAVAIGNFRRSFSSFFPQGTGDAVRIDVWPNKKTGDKRDFSFPWTSNWHQGTETQGKLAAKYKEHQAFLNHS